VACLNPVLDYLQGELLPLEPQPWQITSTLGATPGGYTGKPGRAKRPYFTGLSRGYFKVAEREGFPLIFEKNQ